MNSDLRPTSKLSDDELLREWIFFNIEVCSLLSNSNWQTAELLSRIFQGCGSGLILSGSGSKLKQNFRRQFPSKNFLKSKFESNQIKNTGVIHKKIFKK
jgi:hypothetical protein